MSSGHLLSGEVAETDFKGYYLSVGGWDQSFLGIPGDSIIFIDLLGYLGVVFASNDIIGEDKGIGGGIEGSIGIKYSYKFSEISALTARLGYRVLYNKMGTSDKVETDDQGNEIFEVTETIDFWHGPFLNIVWSF